jgi:beta-lactamase regulating signal transducer with metallopeptidase domain
MLATMIEAAFRSFVLGAVIWTGLRVLRVEGVRTRKAVWVAALLAALLMPLIMQWHSLKVSPPVASQKVANAVRAVPLQVGRLLTPNQPVPTRSAPMRQFDWRAAFIGGAMTIYVAVAALLALRLLIGAALALRLWLRAKPFQASWANGARIRITGAIRMPVAVGSGVLLPAGAEEWDQRRIRTVIAHELCHVTERDFYIQFLAGLHAALFWFSPMSWWLQRELSDLGEAISDEAGLRQAEDRSSYAELLLEVARSSDRHLAGVAMARSGDIGRRIERILSEVSPGTAFTRRRGLVLAAVFVPLVVVIAGFTFSASAAGRAMSLQSSPTAQSSPIAPAAPVAGAPATESVTPPTANAPVPAEPPSAPVPPAPTENSWSWFSDDSGESYAIVAGSQLTIMNGSSDDADRIRRYQSKIHGDYIWFTRSGKSYTIDDPTLLRRAKDLFKPQEELGRKQAILGEQQAKLGEEQEKLGRQQEEVSIPSPEMEKKLVALEGQIDAIRTRMRNLKNQRLQQDDLSALQERVAALQEQLGAAQGKLGEMQGEIGEKQGKLGEDQGKLGEEQGKLGEQQAKLAEEATIKLKSLIDQAVRDGKAKRAD